MKSDAQSKTSKQAMSEKLPVTQVGVGLENYDKASNLPENEKRAWAKRHWERVKQLAEA